MTDYNPELSIKPQGSTKPVEFDLSSVSQPVREILAKSEFEKLCATAPTLPVDAIRALIVSLKNSTSHLIRSNTVLQEEVETELKNGNTKDADEYKLYIKDNEAVIEANGIKEKVLRSVIEGESDVKTEKAEKDTKDEGEDEGVYL